MSPAMRLNFDPAQPDPRSTGLGDVPLQTEERIVMSEKSMIEIVNPTRQELCERALASIRFLKPVNIGCKESPQADAWSELEWCLVALSTAFKDSE